MRHGDWLLGFIRIIRLFVHVMTYQTWTIGVVAFTCQPFYIPTHRQCALPLQSTLSQNEIWSLIDEAVLLYSAVEETPMLSWSSDQTVSNELKQLRKAEVTLLLEDMFMANNHLSRDSDVTQDLSWNDLTQQFDQAIFEEYQSITFTEKEEEWDAWTQRIQHIQVLLEAKLTQSKLITNHQTLKCAAPTFDFVTRLQQLQTLVPPRSSWYASAMNESDLQDDIADGKSSKRTDGEQTTQSTGMKLVESAEVALKVTEEQEIVSLVGQNVTNHGIEGSRVKSQLQIQNHATLDRNRKDEAFDNGIPAKTTMIPKHERPHCKPLTQDGESEKLSQSESQKTDVKKASVVISAAAIGMYFWHICGDLLLATNT